MQSRRDFVKRAAMFVGALSASGSTMFLTACANVENSLLEAFQSILSILSAAGLVPGGSLVTAAINAVISELQAYEAAPANDKTSIGQDLSLAIQLAQARLQTWFAALNLTGPLAIVIESLVSVLLSTLAGLLPTLPSPPTQNEEILRARALPHPIGYKPVPPIMITRRGLKKAYVQFREKFNSVLTAHGYKPAFN